MSRAAEAVLVLAPACLGAFGVLLVDFAAGTSPTRPALTFLVLAASFGGLVSARRAWAPASAPLLLPPAATVAAVGFVVVYRLDRDLADRRLWWLLLGGGLAILLLYALRVGGLERLLPGRGPLLGSAAILAILPLLPSGGAWPLRGVEIDGWRSWAVWHWGTEILIRPGEAARVLLVAFLASYLSDSRSEPGVTAAGPGGLRLPEPRLAALTATAWAAGLVILLFQQDPGEYLLLLGLVVTMLYIATGQPSHLAIGGGSVALGATIAYLLSPPLQEHVRSWLDPWTDQGPAGYRIAQGLFALGAGSLTGTGLGLGHPDLVPSAATGLVWAAVAEELGLAGTVVTLAACALLLAAGFGIALRSRNLFRKLIAGGLSLLLGLQIFLAVAGLVRILPPTGLPTPFLSYGGTSLVTAFAILALLTRVSHEERV